MLEMVGGGVGASKFEPSTVRPEIVSAKILLWSGETARVRVNGRMDSPIWPIGGVSRLSWVKGASAIAAALYACNFVRSMRSMTPAPEALDAVVRIPAPPNRP